MVGRIPNTRCTWCRSPIYRCPAYLERNSKRFCSRQCNGKWLRNRSNKPCPTCQKSFFIGRRKSQKYCSRRCANTGRTGIKYDGTRANCVVRKLEKLRDLIRKTRPEECEICKLSPKWQGKHLRLQIDHIDGNRTNNKPRNLRFLCPNCHSQTPTFGAKNIRRKSGERGTRTPNTPLR